MVVVKVGTWMKIDTEERQPEAVVGSVRGSGLETSIRENGNGDVIHSP